MEALDQLVDLEVCDIEGQDTGLEILNLLIERLPNDIKVIKQLFLTKNYPLLASEVHKLHGAICYCSLPRLKYVIGRLETDIKNNIMASLPALLELLDAEATLLLKHYPPPKQA